MQFHSEDTEKFLELSKWRRDVRRFKRDAVCKESIAILKRAIAYAPSVGNSRPWRFVNVNDAYRRQSIITNFEKANQEAAEIYSDEKKAHYNRLKLAGLKEAPIHLAVFTDINPSEGAGLGRQTMPETLAYSTVMAIHQLWLAARSLNLGVGWVSILDTDSINALLDVPQEWLFTAYLCVGYPQFSSDEPELQTQGWQENIESDWLQR